jgi:hypothetical protein
MARAVIGFVVAAAIWMPAFFLLASGLGNLVWADYGTHGQIWLEQRTYTFPSSMSVFNALCWATADVLVGWLAVAIGRRRQAAWALAAVIGAYACLLHLIVYWPGFPWWYNLAVALPAAPAVLLGGRLAGRFVRPGAPAVVA